MPASISASLSAQLSSNFCVSLYMWYRNMNLQFIEQYINIPSFDIIAVDTVENTVTEPVRLYEVILQQTQTTSRNSQCL